MTQMFFYLTLSLGINILLFIPAFLFNTDKLTDLSYSLSFIFLVFLSFFLNTLHKLNILVGILILVWAIRLGTFLFIRIKNIKKDKRFNNIRNNFLKFLSFWFFQGLSVWIILLPFLFFSNSNNPELFYFGILVWFTGFITESVSDFQKYQNKKKHPNNFVSTGLWKFSRHPNYFGEILCWAGIYLAVFPSLELIEKIISLVSPFYIFILLRFISGIPILEKNANKKYKKNEQYQNYKNKTNLLIPWFPKK